MLQCTSSLLLSRLDTEQSSIFICQNYQMNSQRCGHAVALHAWAKSGLQQRGSAELAALTHTFVPLNVWGNSQLNWEPRELLRYAYNLKNIDKTENFRRTAQRPLLRRALPLNHAAQVNR